MFSDLLKALDLLGGKVRELYKRKNERLNAIFDVVVDSSYKDLEVIHRDNSLQLSRLRDHLVNKSLPPRELVQWLRNVGLEYRDKREALQTIEVELNIFIGRSIDPMSIKKVSLIGICKDISRQFSHILSAQFPIKI